MSNMAVVVQKRRLLLWLPAIWEGGLLRNRTHRIKAVDGELGRLFRVVECTT